MLTLLSNETLTNRTGLLRNSTDDLRILLATEMCGRQLCPLIMNMSYLVGTFLPPTSTYRTPCPPNAPPTQGSFPFSALKRNRNQSEYDQSKPGQSEPGKMLQNTERPLRFRCLHCEDANSNSLTRKLTELILRKGVYPQCRPLMP